MKNKGDISIKLKFANSINIQKEIKSDKVEEKDLNDECNYNQTEVGLQFGNNDIEKLSVPNHENIDNNDELDF